VLSGGVFRGISGNYSPQAHRRDTLIAGRGLNDLKLVDVLVEEAPRRLEELAEWGMVCEKRGPFLFAKGSAPAWGKAISSCLVDKARSVGVGFVGSTIVLSLSSRDQEMRALGFRRPRGPFVEIRAGAIVLATGGAGALYLRHDNPKGMIGSGYALALEMGAQLQDMEFVQFYPVGLAQEGLPPLLIPPRLADKGRLRNTKGEEILEKWEISERPAAEKARDKLSQAMFQEMRQGQEIWLDLGGIAQEDLANDPLSSSCAALLKRKIGGLERPLKVAPMAHFTMGGVRIDPWCRTKVPGFFVAGEAAGGLHGANRLGGNGLTEAIVFGARAGRSAALWAKENGPRKDGSPLWEAEVVSRPPELSQKGFLERLRKTMWELGGIIRSGEGLMEARRILESQMEEVGFSRGHRKMELGTALHPFFRAANVAMVILEASLRREESRGAHFREDFPGEDRERWSGHLIVEGPSLENLRWSFEPLHEEGNFPR
jgi:aspartate oxidase